jgi:hypothetical protein
VYRERPTPGQLLDDRLARGWRPTPSGLREGPRVLGYAACVLDGASQGGSPSTQE